VRTPHIVGPYILHPTDRHAAHSRAHAIACSADTPFPRPCDQDLEVPAQRIQIGDVDPLKPSDDG
jgi:hypothetical protein